MTKVIPRSMEAALNQDSLEEDMIQGLQQASWQKVDLSFHSAIWPFFAHNPVGVHHEWLSDGAAGVIAHMFKKNKFQTSVKTSIRVRTTTLRITSSSMQYSHSLHENVRLSHACLDSDEKEQSLFMIIWIWKQAFVHGIFSTPTLNGEEGEH
jgi:hypothetical protein